MSMNKGLKHKAVINSKIPTKAWYNKMNLNSENTKKKWPELDLDTHTTKNSCT